MDNRGRGHKARRKSNAPIHVEQSASDQIYVNPGISTLNIGTLSIPPGATSMLDKVTADHPIVRDWLKQGTLRRIPYVRCVRRMSGTLRILVVVHTLFRGGAEVSTIELHRALKSHGAIQCLMNLYIGDRNESVMLADDAKDVFDLYYERHMDGSISYTDEIIKMVESFRPDLMMYSTLSAVPDAMIPVRGRPPLLQVMHSELGDTIGAYSHATDGVITVSRAMARNRQKDGIPADKLYPVWNGIDPDRVKGGRSLREELSIPRDATVLAMIGNLNSIKRPIMGLEAFARTRRSKDFLIYAGNPVELHESLLARIDDLALMPYIRILGFRNDIENVLATIDILINCSETEGLPMTIVEAMFCGKAVIASAVGGNAEIVKHKSTGLLFPAEDYNALDSHLRTLLRDSDLRKKMGAAGLRRAKRYFRIETVAKQYMEVIGKYLFKEDELRCSVVMPAYNAEATIDRAVWSIRDQTMAYCEIIIVNDGSTDKTLKLLKRHAIADERIRIVEIEHSGIVEALNRGVLESRTDIIVRMDADDEMVPHRLQMQLDYLEEHPDVDIMGSQMLYRSADGEFRGPGHAVPLSHKDIVDQLYEQNALCHPTVAFRKAAFLDVGGYHGDGRCEDYRLWTDLAVAGYRFANIKEPLVIYTLTHENNSAYHEWRDSATEGIRESYRDRMEAV